MSEAAAQPLVRRLVHRLRAPATGAVVAQVWQALGTFVIQILAARILGAEGLGSMALCLGVIIMTAAITSGMVGDSLTVLDRHDRSIRAGLQAWTVLLAVVGSSVCGAVLLATGVLEVWGAVAFAAAAALFQIEEILRRLLMASMRFWALVIVDTSSVLGTLGLLAVLSRSGLSLATFLVAIAGGQLLGACVAFGLLSPQERRLVSFRGAALSKVAAFGAWRGAQVGVTPAALTVSRTAVIAVAGVVALGQLEAARILVAPLLLVVQGLGSYLLASYARDKAAPLARLMDRAARASTIMAVGAIGLGCVAAALTPFVAPLLTGPSVHVSWVAVLGWAVYSAASATLQPFASLAATRGRQRAVLLLRIADSIIGLACLVLLLRVFGAPVFWTPYVLALSLFLSGVVMRIAVLRPMSRESDRDTHGGPDGGPHPKARADEQLVGAGAPRPVGGETPERVLSRLRWLSAGQRRWARTVAASAVIALGAAGLTAVPASADPLPTPLPAPVGASALPTWQINGVAWSQAIVGNTVYVVGSFTKARPPGVPVGGAGEIPASNIFAYDLTTGNRVASFDHSLNGQGLTVQASPDGSRVYVGGDFTAVDGQVRGHVAAFNTSDGSLVSTWDPNVTGQVRALSITTDTVYVGGNFRSANGLPRTSLAAFNTANRNMTDWAPTAEGTGGYVWAMTLSPDLSRVIVGGSFSTLSGQAAYGMGALDASTAAVLPWAANQRIRTAGLNGGITSLKTDGEQIYGSGYAFGDGASFEGTFAADPGTGAINWVNDCLGDTYDVFPMNQALYSVAHAHDCSVIGGFPDTNPRARWQKASASPTFPTGMTTVKDAYGWDFRNLPYAGLLQWYPDLEFGTYTPDRQAAWSVTGSGNYVTLAGEFPIVNGTAQQGLVRFANRSAATPSQKPAYSAGMNPVATSTESGTVRLTWTSTWDRDDNNLTYDVYRDGGASIGNVSGPSTFWQLPSLGFRDTGRTPGATHTYKVRVKDSDGNVQWSVASAPVTVSSTAPSAYTQAVRADSATHHWKLNDSGSTFLDSSGFADGTAASSTFGASGALTGDSAVSSSGGSNPKLYSRTSEEHPTAATVEAWVKTSSSQGGRVVGFGNSMNGTSAAATNDLVLYVTSNGRASFGVNNGAWKAVTSTRTVNDGQWHHLAATADSSGLSLFVDGRRVGRDQTPVTMATFPGYWRMLADQTSGLPSAPSSQALSGSIDEVAVYPNALTQAKVKAHYLASGRSANWATPGADAYAQSVVTTAPDNYWRLGESSGSTAVDGSGSGGDGSITGVSFNRSGAISGTTNTAALFNGSSGLLVAKEPWVAPSSYSTELWFSSTSTRGGKLIGFGNATSGLSSSYDRQVVLLSNGRLQFGVKPGAQVVAETTGAYNDGQWHHVVATQGSDGMKLYVDSVLRASNATTDAQTYTGYWRVGGDRTFGGTSSNYVNATIDEAAVYPTVLGQADVDAHYAASGRQLPNKAPTSAFTVSKNHLALAVDGSTSTDPDGTIASYAWTFGDGATATTATATHTYAAGGTYPVSLKVTDNSGATNTRTENVTVAPNAIPVAAFTSSANLLAAAFDATSSSDPDGTIASYAWNFGDGTTGTGASPTHTFPDDGTYQVALVVTDNSGATATVTRAVTVARPPNVLPTAVMTHAEAGLSTSLNGSGSSDPDGDITAYAWAFGDGATGTGATTSHTYATDGTYDVVLTVTDDRGGSHSVTQSVTVAANQKPVARFTHDATFLAVSVDGSGSTDADGTVAAYAWNFGDGSSGTGATATHTYAAAGTYTVVLTVTDNAGGTATVEHDVTVAANPALATDEFGRTSVNGWGTADLGGAWTVAGTASRYSVADGVGKVVLAVGASGTTTLGSVATSTTESAITLSTDKAPTGGGQYVSVIGRKVSATSDYRAKIRLGADGVVTVWLARTVNGTESLIVNANVPGLTYAAGDKLRTRLQVSGTSPTQLRVKVWKDGTAEPASWLLTTTDTTAELQTTGSAGIYSYVSGSTTNAPVTFAYDSLWVGGLRP